MKSLKAGCILVNKEMNKIGLIYRKEYQDYSFPKGHLEENESLLECAIRETAEETKRDCLPYQKEPIAINYYQTSKEESEVYYYLVIDIGKSNNTSPETHELIWVPYEEVEQKLSFDNLKEVWQEAKETVKKVLKDNHE